MVSRASVGILARHQERICRATDQALVLAAAERETK